MTKNESSDDDNDDDKDDNNDDSDNKDSQYFVSSCSMSDRLISLFT